MAKGRPGLTIVTHALSERVLFDGKRAVGVSYLRKDETVTAHARREVLVCAGAIASPALLQRSGLGPADLLRDLGVSPVAEIPGVGANLQDHLEMYLQYECTQPVSLYPALKWWNQPAIGAEWLFMGTGTGASNQFEAGGFIRSDESFAWPNIQYHFLPVAINYNGTNAVNAHGFQAHVGSMRSPSRGRIQAKSRDPREAPSILFNYMSTAQDWREFRDAIRITREIMAQPALDPYRGREISPGVDFQSDAELDEFVRQHGETAYHPSARAGWAPTTWPWWTGRAGSTGGRAPRDRRLDHAADHHGEPERADHHDGGEAGRRDPGPGRPAARRRALLCRR